MTLSTARDIANDVVAKLKPCCERVLIGGSIRRQAKEISDIDVIVIPQRDGQNDMFGQFSHWEVAPEFIQAVNSWTKIKGEPTGKYTQRLLPEMIKLEISICTRQTYPSISLIRTGDKDFTHMIMKRALKMGFEQRDGLLYDGDKPIQLLDETDYFKVLNLPFVLPENRDKNAFRR